MKKVATGTSGLKMFVEPTYMVEVRALLRFAKTQITKEPHQSIEAVLIRNGWRQDWPESVKNLPVEIQDKVLGSALRLYKLEILDRAIQASYA